MSEKCQCAENAETRATVKFYCKTCSSVIDKIQIKKPLKAGAIAAVLAYGGSQFIDYAITDNRYPLDVEYAVLEACASSYNKPMAYRDYGEKRELCLCAMEDTMNEISYVRFKVDESGFLEAFENNVQSCK
ncbi:MAG: hypothetical protein HRU24_13070 [Gammaproteobacteria bacterium]|nr:hypothetical protein [Gammaproteobacteria bacterium]